MPGTGRPSSDEKSLDDEVGNWLPLELPAGRVVL
jgi:hypothetical protein